MSEPWIGPHFATTRLLLLGESAYSWVEDSELHHPSPKHCTENVEWVVNDFAACVRAGPFLPKLSRALTGEYSPTRERLRFVWDRVAYTNYVTQSVGTGAGIRPSEEMWQKAYEDFPQLLAKIQPQRVIVLGREMWSRMPEADLHITADTQGYKLPSGGLCMCWAVGQRGVSWEELAAIVHFTHANELQGEERPAYATP